MSDISEYLDKLFPSTLQKKCLDNVSLNLSWVHRTGEGKSYNIILDGAFERTDVLWW